MTNHLNLFAPAARIAMPTLSAGPVKHTHDAPRTGHTRPSVVDDLLSIIDDGIVCCRCQRQPAAIPARTASIGSHHAASAWIERP
jgi:hypothetical protein